MITKKKAMDNELHIRHIIHMINALKHIEPYGNILAGYRNRSRRTLRKRLKRMDTVRHSGYVSYKPKMRKKQLKKWWYIRFKSHNLSIVDFSKVNPYSTSHSSH